MHQVDPRHVLVAVARALKKCNIPYIVSGGVALLVWGRPRFTADIDIVVELSAADLDKLERALRSLSKAGYINREAMEEALGKKGEFNFIDGDSGMKVDFWVMQDTSFDKARLRRKKLMTILGEKICVSSPEDLILIKLLWYQKNFSVKQKEDIESIWAISSKKLDLDYLKKMASELHIAQTLFELLPHIKK